MVMWFSPGLASSAKLDGTCMKQRSMQPASHDYLFNTVLGLFDVHTAIYDPAWDITHACRR
jgi:lipid A ethanolaminephosphotransferase